MIGTCSMRLVCRFCSWPTPQSMPNVHDGRHGRSPRARLRLREARFFTYKNLFSFAVFECTNYKLHYIKKVTIPHMCMANINVCRYSQRIAPKTPTTQAAVQLPMSSAVFLVNRKSPPRLFPYKHCEKRQ